MARCFGLWRDLVSAEVATFPQGAAYPQPNLDDPEAMGSWFQKFTRGLTDVSCRYLVAEVEGKIVGFLLADHCQRDLGEPKFFINAAEMFIVPAYRKSEVYLALEEACEEWAKELQVDTIECSAVYTEPQIGRWVSRGFHPYMISLYRRARWKEQS